MPVAELAPEAPPARVPAVPLPPAAALQPEHMLNADPLASQIWVPLPPFEHGQPRISPG
jgi:hypothetical protein